jgi:hypothetical protein
MVPIGTRHSFLIAWVNLSPLIDHRKISMIEIKQTVFGIFIACY